MEHYMKEEFAVQQTIKRVQWMEFYFDTLQEAVRRIPDALREDGPLKEMLMCLIDYYESGQWMEDYRCDEQGKLPKDLKRGVLSEDGVYNFLSDIEKDGST